LKRTKRVFVEEKKANKMFEMLCQPDITNFASLSKFKQSSLRVDLNDHLVYFEC